ncbi:MAG TPA: hypothetical protein VJQ54_15545, partial [Candidatus Sulfotelmatobacter sp.]|nr:hypothetical protein [Candidatus Sulfotelmatobacter sp.]
MRKLSRGLLSGVCALGLASTSLAQAQTEQTSKPRSESVALAELPDSPGASRAQEQNPPAQQNGATQPADQAQQSNP